MTIKQFIKKFNFPNHSWTDIPTGFPDCDTSKLTVEEEVLFEAIKIAWINDGPGRSKFYYDIVRNTLITIAIVTGILGINKLTNTHLLSVESVNAATISATLKHLTGSTEPINIQEAIESTFSGVMKEHK